MMYTVLLLITSYIIGSLPTGYIIARLFGVHDIRLHGSGNIGATNVARILGIRFFIPVFLFDALKAYGNVALLLYMGYEDWVIISAAIAHLVGNGCSLFLNGQGGKGIATTVGLTCALMSHIMPYTCIIWLLVFLCTKTVGLASVAAILSFPLLVYIKGYSLKLLLFSCFVSCWIVIRHRINIQHALITKG